MQLPKLTDLVGITNPTKTAQKLAQHVDTDNLPQKEVYFAWESTPAIERKEMNKKLVRTLTIIGVVVALLLVIMQEFLMIVVIASLIFFVQAVTRFNPEKIKFELSNHGLMYNDTMYYWQQLKHFFFTTTNGVEVLAVDTYAVLPGRVFIPFSPEDKVKINGILKDHLHFLEVAPHTAFDTAYTKVMDKFDFTSNTDTPAEEPKPQA